MVVNSGVMCVVVFGVVCGVSGMWIALLCVVPVCGRRCFCAVVGFFVGINVCGACMKNVV